MTQYLPEIDPSRFDFPPMSQVLSDPQGLLAWGGDLSVTRLLYAYQQGIFPWYSEPPILWWAPSPRMVIEPSTVHISSSMKKLLKKEQYSITFDNAFERVIKHCAKTKRSTQADNNSHETWINEDMIFSYTDLYHAGYGHSVEVWDKQNLVGGLYGVSIGKMFFGESMFSTVSNTSKIAFIALCRLLQAESFALIDCQLPTSHLDSLGAYSINMHDFQNYLDQNQQLGIASYWSPQGNKRISTFELMP